MSVLAVATSIGKAAMSAASAGASKASRTEETTMMRTEGKRAVAGSHLHMMTMRIDRRGFILVPGLLAAVWCLERGGPGAR
jgi:hypothetical protein